MEERTLLPVKEKDGRWIFRTEAATDEVAPENENITEPIATSKHDLPENFVQQYASEQKKLIAAKNKIGLLSTTIVEDPERNVSCLRELINMFEKPSTKMIVTEKKLLALSLLRVFSHILPGYKIRTDIEYEKKVKLKKETKLLLGYETSLVRYYKKYVTILQSMIADMKFKKDQKNVPVVRRKAVRAIGLVAVKCMCELMVTRYTFNYIKIIISVVVPTIAIRKSTVSAICCKALEKLYKTDKLGEASFEAVKQTVKVIKERKFCVPVELLRTFLSLNLQEAKIEEKKMDMKQVRKKLRMMSRKEKRQKKKMKELEVQLRETEAVESKEIKSTLQTEMLKKLFWVYFHILKDDQKIALITPALEGLSQYAHLINVEFYDDLSIVLCSLMEEEALADFERLHCMQTVFTILSGQAESLNIDPQKLYSHLYKILLNIKCSTTLEQFQVTLKCLDLMIIKRRKSITLNRILAFLKRLCTVCLQTPVNYTLPLLCIIRTIFLTTKKCNILLDTENSFGSGLFMPELEDPEHCNASSTSLWELHVLKNHENPFVSMFAFHILKGCPSQGKAKLPERLTRLSPEQVLRFFTDHAEDIVVKPEENRNSAKKVCMSDGVESLAMVDDDELSITWNDVRVANFLNGFPSLSE